MLDIKCNKFIMNASAMSQVVDFEELFEFGFVQIRQLAPFLTVCTEVV